MKAATIGIVILFIGWIMTVMGKTNSDPVLMFCAVPILLLGVLVYHFKPKSAKPNHPLDMSRQKDEQHLPEWVIKARRQMERDSQQTYNWRNDTYTPVQHETFEQQANRYMNMSMKDWPATLHQTLTTVGNRIGVSGDVIYEVVLAWLRAGGRRALTYEEVIGG